ncbi:MAG: fasciclin domain-containing protein [Ilumatobacteraceae bacterium]|nr:fasciclin domain-containing protein [Ilumatobacteraceae bacterium]
MKKVFAVAIAAALTLAACGSDDEASEDTVAEDTVAEEVVADGDIVAVASGNPDFSTLVAALSAAGLVETLQGEGPFTVFAPTDAAFAALPEGLLEKLLLPENIAVLTAILTYHVVPGKVMSTDVTAGDVATVEGSTIAITTDMGVMVNGANVVAVDVAASNGVIHVIDAVIVPPTVDLSTL